MDKYCVMIPKVRNDKKEDMLNIDGYNNNICKWESNSKGRAQY